MTYVATWIADPGDREMERRIRAHRERRPAEWRTVENRVDLAVVIRENANRCVLLDCLTLWLGARMGSAGGEGARLDEWAAILESARASLPLFLVVSNEVGSGIVPESPEGRAFRDLAGRANQITAAAADRVDFMVAGIPWPVKGGSPA